MKVLVLGAGQIGTAVARATRAPHEVIVRTRRQLDIVNPAAVSRVLGEVKADWVINAAAYTWVDRAEDECAEAKSVNDTAVGSIAEGAEREGCRLLHLSTDFVFDGKSNRPYGPADEPHPLGVYGATKLAGERYVSGTRSGIVLRTSWVYSSAGRNFVLTMLKLMREREQIRVVSDQIGSPTWAASAAEAIWAIINAEAPRGVYHWSDLGLASRYDFAVAIQDEALQRGLLPRAIEILPISSEAFPTRATRPYFSVLDSSETRSLLKMPALHWRYNLRMMLDEFRAA